MIGLPTMLQDDDIDQDLPLDLDDEFITPEKILSVPSGYINLMTASNAQTRLMKVLRKVIKYVYPIKGIQYMESKPRSYVVGHAKIREIERDLQHWMEDLPMFLRPGGEVTPELARYECSEGGTNTSFSIFRPRSPFKMLNTNRSQSPTITSNGLCLRSDVSLSTILTLCVENESSSKYRQAFVCLCRCLRKRLKKCNPYYAGNEPTRLVDWLVLVRYVYNFSCNHVVGFLCSGKSRQ